MQRLRFALLVSLAVALAILLTTANRTSAADIAAGPLSQMQQQIDSLNSVVADQQEQINALRARRPDFDLREYTSLDPGTNVFRATRYIKTPIFYLKPGNGIFGTLTIQQYYEGEQLVQRWEEIYDGPNPNLPSVPPPNPFTAEFLVNVTSEGLVETGYRFINQSGVNTSTTYYNPALLVFPFGLHSVGDMWGGAYIERFEIVSLPENVQRMSRLYQYAIVGIETVTVPAGTFTDCIKIARYRGNATDRIGWYAKGVGAVKFIFTSKDLTENNTLNGIYQLEQRY